MTEPHPRHHRHHGHHGHHGHHRHARAWRVAGKGHPGEHDYDRALINAMYDEREAYVIKRKKSDLVTRYKSERQAALKMLEGAAAGGHS